MAFDADAGAADADVGVGEGVDADAVAVVAVAEAAAAFLVDPSSEIAFGTSFRRVAHPPDPLPADLLAERAGEASHMAA